MATGKVRAIIKRPDEKYGHMTNISTTLENLQRTVSGYIEAISLGGIHKGLWILCNEDGHIQELPFNMYYPYEQDLNLALCGTIIIIGQEGEEFCDIPIEFAEWKMIVDKTMAKH